jgi:NTE family protein
VGGNRASGASFASYLLFESEFTRELIELGRRDALAKRAEIAAWIAAPAGDGTS